MKAQTEKTVAKQSKAVAGASPARQLKPDPETQFEDRRPAAVGQREMAGKADSSPQAGRIAQLQAMADGSAAGTVQRLGLDEEEPLQGKFETIQKQEEEEELQMKSETIQRQGPEEEELLQGKFETVQRQGAEEEEELLQGKFETIQRQGLDEEEIQAKSATLQKKDEQPANNTGLPDNLKSSIENLSGLSLDDVKLHYNSPKPAQLQAHAFAQGTDIHMAPGQEKHLPHEAWHVVQQKQGRVRPTMQMKGKVKVNDDVELEKEADLMGAKAISRASLEYRLPLNAESKGSAPLMGLSHLRGQEKHGLGKPSVEVYQLHGESIGRAYRRFMRWIYGNEALPANLYRWDPLGPIMVGEHGLPERDAGGTVSLKEHVRGSNDVDGKINKYESQWMSTGAWEMLGKLDGTMAQQIKVRTLYKIDPTRAQTDSGKSFQNVGEHFDDIGKKQPYPGQHEWALEGAISPASIVGYMTGEMYLGHYNFDLGGIPGGEASLTGWLPLPAAPQVPTEMTNEDRKRLWPDKTNTP